MFKKILCKTTLLLFVPVITIYADVISFKASVDKNTIPLNESFIYSITISGDGTAFPKHQVGSIAEFNRLGTTTSQSMSIVNGKTNVNVTYKYTLNPKKIGKFTIQPAKITFNDKTYLTESVEIEVTPAQSVHSQNVNSHNTQNLSIANNQQQSRRQSSSNSQGKAFVKASINKKNAYENEKLIYKFSFYTNVDLISNPEYYPPDFSGFWNDGSKSKSYFEIIDGSNYRVDEIETTLYPIGIGGKTILPAKLKIAITDFSSSSEMDDFFSLFSNMGRRQTKVLETNKIEVRVIPIPQEGKPMDFSGTIGDFKIKASVDKNDVNTNEPVILTVTVSGNGNMKSVSSINFNNYDDFRKYDTIVANTLDNLKEFKTIFIPLVSGEKEIPVAKLSFFNPIKKQYKTVETQPHKITVKGAAVHFEENSKNKSKRDVVRKDINYNKQIKTLNLYKGYLIEKSKFYLLFIPFVVLFILSAGYKICVNKIFRNPFKKLRNSYFVKAQKFIKEAETEISRDNFVVSLELIYQALIEIINIKTNIVSDNLQNAQILDNLRRKGVSEEKISEIIRILETLNFYKFASVNLDKISITALLNDVRTLDLKK
ncbi:MAG: BatD family protein [Endomicrobium sp.]|jgi:hypothetical protein|nr:BatD family protein [Endomicrobium sp.]